VKSPLAPLTSFDYFVDGSGICISGKTDENEILASDANVHSRMQR